MQQALSIALIGIFAVAAYVTPAKAAVQAHADPTTCSVTTNATTGYKTVFVGHIKDGDTVYLQQANKSRRIYRGHTYTNRSEAASVHSANGWTQICSG
jgi:hypothetical protein